MNKNHLKYFSFLILIIFCNTLIAQKIEEKFFLNGNLKTRDSIDISNNITYRKEFYNSGLLFKSGKLIDNKKVGKWIEIDYEFLPTNKKLDADAEFSEIIYNYKNDTLDGDYFQRYYYYQNKNPRKYKIIKGFYVKGKKEGEWKRFGVYKNDSIINLYMVYINDEQISRMEWNQKEKNWNYLEFKNGKIFGRIVEYHKNNRRKAEGRKETIQTTDSMELVYPTGIWIYWDSSGRINKTQIFEGYIPFYNYSCNIFLEFSSKNKKSMEGRYNESNERDGKWIFYDSIGKPLKSEFYINGKRKDSSFLSGIKFINAKIPYTDSSKILYQNGLRNGESFIYAGTETIQLNFKNDFLHGDYLVYEGRKIKCKGEFVGGKKEGKFSIYSAEGKIQREFIYINGYLREEKVFSPEGLFIEKLEFPGTK